MRTLGSNRGICCALIAASLLNHLWAAAAAENREATMVHDYDAVPALSVPADVESQVGQIIVRHRRLTERCLEILDPANRKSFDYKQRAGAARILGEFRVEQAIPWLFLLMVEDLEHDRMFITDLNVLDSPAYNALARIGKEAIPGSLEMLRTTDHPKLQTQCVMLIYNALGSKDALLKALESAASLEADAQAAGRLTSALDWAADRVRDRDSDPATRSPAS